MCYIGLLYYVYNSTITYYPIKNKNSMRTEMYKLLSPKKYNIYKFYTPHRLQRFGIRGTKSLNRKEFI